MSGADAYNGACPTGSPKRPPKPARNPDDTIDEAITNGREALRDCMEVFRESGRKIPTPSIAAAQWRQRLPRTLYSKLTKQAENEGVSINSLVMAIIAEAIGAKQAR